MKPMNQSRPLRSHAEQSLIRPVAVSSARRYPDKFAQQAFERAIAGEEEDPDADLRERPSPVSLLASAATVSQPERIDAAEDRLSDLIVAMVKHLYVSRDSEHHSVMMELTDDLLPGVTLTVYEDARVVANFVCAVETSRLRLCDIATRLVRQLADALLAPSRVRVTTDDPMDPCDLEADAEPTAGSRSTRDDC
jgi:hypothetical protein